MSFGLDVRHGMRRLRRAPAVTAIAIVTLALGIGATCTIFTVVNTVLLQPLPFRDPERLVAVAQTTADRLAGSVPVSFTKYEALRDQSRSLETLAVYYPLTVSLGGDSEPELLEGARVSGDVFGALGTRPALGRGFTPQEDAPGGADVAVITDGLWHRRFGGDPAVLGRRLRLDGRDVAIVGVLPATFRFPLQLPEPQLWLPRVFEPDFLTRAQVHSGAGYLSLVARLRDGESVAHAQAELQTIEARYAAQFASYVDATRFHLQATPLAESLVGAARGPLVVLLAAVAFVLAIACANVASLQLARASTRVREIAVRKALGASRPRLVGQLLIESLGLALVGGGLGVLLAFWTLPLAQRVSAGTLPRLEETHVDGAVLLFALALCGVTSVAFGIVPALHASRGDVQDGLRHGGRGSSDGGARRRLRVLFVAETAVALVLVTGAGLLIKSLTRLVHVDPGFETRGVMTMPVALPASRYPEPARQAEFYRQLLERVAALPGVASAAGTSALPLAGNYRMVFFCPEGQVCQGIGKDPVIAMRQVTPGYFETMRTRLVAGRGFTAADTATSVPVVVVNETTARRFWPGESAVGKHLANSRDRTQREIVGVVANVKFRALDAPDVEEMYLPLAQVPWPTVTIVARSDADPRPIAAAVRQEVARLDPDIAIAGAQGLSEVVAGSVAQPQLVVRVVATFAALALALACIGIYGVMTYSVAERTREFGVRMALGADARNVLGLVVREGMGLALVGVGAGMALSLGVTRLLAAFLFGVTATDPWTFAGAAFLIALTALVACAAPAWRGMRLEPVRALRRD